MVIKHDNIIYVRDLSEIGGVETYAYEMVKKYRDLDIAVVYKTADPYQLQRIEEYCPTYEHTNQDIECKVAIINYDVTIIPYITEKIWKENAKEGEGIFQAIHGDYEHSAYHWKSPTDVRIKDYIAITKYLLESVKRITGNKNVIMSYNPLTIDKHPLMLVSMTRLSKIKGKDRMRKLANALDAAGVDYIWYVFTNDTEKIDSANVIYMQPRLDAYKWLAHATYLVQLSDTERLLLFD